MKGFTKLLALAVIASVFAVSCSKDKQSGSIKLDVPAIYLSGPEVSVTIGFSLNNVKSFYTSTYPTGWDEPVLDFTNQTVTFKAPTAEKIESGDAVKTGTVSFLGRTPNGTLVSASYFAGIVTTVDLSDKVANSYIASEKEANYTFDATRKGNNTKIDTDRIGIIWQSKSNLLTNVQFVDGKGTFYIGADSKDDTKINSGNALIGAYNAAGEIIWSWHIWATDFDPDATALVYSNGATVMDRNLGALGNSNSTNAEILASYGLYYQWGRKDPFIGPYTYNAEKGESASLLTSTGSYVYIKMVASSAETGTLEYATKNPLHFITGVSESNNNWLWGDNTTPLWSATKTDNDPCPHGWEVAFPEAFADLTIADDLNAGYEPYYNKYAWTLSLGDVSSLYFGFGRRRYDNGKILNVYNPVVRSEAVEAQPWEGIYWTSRMDGTQSKAFYFWFDKKNVAASGIQNETPYFRANGLQVRCVKIYSRP